MFGRSHAVDLGILLVVGTFVLGALVSSPMSRVSSARVHSSYDTQLSGMYDLLGSDSSMGVDPPRGSLAPTSQPVMRSKKSGDECQPPYGWLETQGVWIVEAKNPKCRIRLAGVTWYGMQSTNFAPAGLNFRTYQNILFTVKRLGFNSIRIPLSDQLVLQNKRRYIKSNVVDSMCPCKGKYTKLHPLDLLDRIVKAAQHLNLMIILDNHFSIARSATITVKHREGRQQPRSSIVDDNTIWDGGVTEKEWIQDWVNLAKRYKNYPNVIGFDLRNEPHTNYQHHAHWSLNDYLHDGATWGPCTPDLCGSKSKDWNPASNWVTAADAAGDAVQKVNRNLLLFVEGVQLYPDKSKYGVESYWWGSILKGVATQPVEFTYGNHLVYSPHEWGPWKCCANFAALGNKSFSKAYKQMAKVFNANWGYILTMKDPKPIWLGEFDTCNTRQTHARPKIPKAVDCVYPDNKNPSQGKWFQILLQYLKYHPEIGWAYYPLNGTNAEDEPSNNSILNGVWSGARLGQMMALLKPLEKQPAPAN